MLKTIRDFEVKNKRLLVRCDFNVPLDAKGGVIDDFKIKNSIPTVEYLIKKNARVILMSHLDKPEGKVVESLRLTSVQEKLLEYLDVSIVKARDCVGKEIEKWSLEMQPGEILLLENLRFHEGEETNDPEFSENLSKIGDIFINDAFGCCHRAHASTVGVTKYLPGGIGFLVEKEIEMLTKLLKKSKRPLIAIVGGKKAETKVKMINKISEIADWVLIGGIMKKGLREQKISLKFPEKIIEADEGLDIVPKDVEIFKEKIATAETIFWNGPLGMIEKDEYLKGTEDVVQAITKTKAFKVAGGGETMRFLNKYGLSSKFDWVSTGGGAMLQFLSGEKLPAIEALK